MTSLVLDSGALFELMPFCAYFFDFVEFDIDIKDISKLNKGIGFGSKLHKFTTTNGYLLCAPVFPFIFYQLIFDSSIPKLIINSMCYK